MWLATECSVRTRIIGLDEDIFIPELSFLSYYLRYPATHYLLAGERGFEPLLYGPEPYVLPLDDSPLIFVFDSVTIISKIKFSIKKNYTTIAKN